MPPRLTEAEIQGQIVEGLRALGYEVLVTTARSVRSGYGADHGVPDLLVRRVGWRIGGWLGVEVKRPGAVRWSHGDQRRLWEAGHTVVARSLEEACYGIFAHSVFTCDARTFGLARMVAPDDRDVVVARGFQPGGGM